MLSLNDKLNIIKLSSISSKRKKIKRQQEAILDAKEILQTAAPAYAAFNIAKQLYYDINAAKGMINALKVIKAL